MSGNVSDLKYRFAHYLKTTILVLDKCFQLGRLESIFAQAYTFKTFLLLLKKLFMVCFDLYAFSWKVRMQIEKHFEVIL